MLSRGYGKPDYNIAKAPVTAIWGTSKYRKGSVTLFLGVDIP